MDIFKLRPGLQPIYRLTAIAFHNATGKRPPWYQENNGPKHYAVCPECDNPVHIVNLDVDKKVDADGRALPLYAKHASVSVADIAEYDKTAYEQCTLANPKNFNGQSKTRTPGPTSDRIIRQLVEFADLVHWQVERFLGIGIPDEEFNRILQEFHRQEGHLYREVSSSNLPYALLYMAGNQRIFQPRVSADSPFREAAKKSTHFYVDGTVVRRKTSSPKATLRFFVTDHQVKRIDGAFQQTMSLVIEEEVEVPGSRSGERKELYRQSRPLEISYFCNAMGKRIRLRQLAESVFNK